MSRNLRLKRGAISAAVLALVALAAGGLLGWLVLPRLSAGLLPPQARWAARSFDHYRLSYAVTGLVDCQVVAEVRAEAVVASQTTPQGEAFCAPMSVTGLFKRIETLSQGSRCGPNGCGCDSPETLSVSYDTTLGYPTLIEQQLRPDQRWRYFEYWVYQLAGGGCTAVGYVGTRIEVTSLTPQP